MGLILIFVVGVFSQPLVVVATPLLALKEAQNCGGCHTPGRSQRPPLERRCTLDCQGCHIDPNGAGPRNQWGFYYAQDQLPTASFFKPQDPLKDSSRFDLHFDSRFMARSQEGQSKAFPMNSEFSLRLRPFIEWLHLTYQLNLLGRAKNSKFPGYTQAGWRYQEKFSAMVDALPLNTYIRLARGTPLYGLRRPNHSSWIRERIGLNQFALTDALTIGGTPNVPFLHTSYMLGDPNAPVEDRQRGLSFHGGMRGVTMAWHVNTSYWNTQSKKAAVNMHALGGGANIFDFVIMLEKNWRTLTAFALPISERLTFQSEALRLHPSSVIEEVSLSYTGLRGINLGSVWERLNDEHRQSERKSLFVDLHPIPYLQIEFWHRLESGTRLASDNLFIVHLYGDF